MDTAGPATPEVSILVPARNEEVCLRDCLLSLAGQEGVGFEIIVVDDHSVDRTRSIAESVPGVRVVEAGPLPAGWTGKNNALVTGVREARGRWLLFTDADTIHRPGSLARAVAEAQQHGADLLSYSPEQVVKSFWERAVMPVVFAELAAQYPPEKVRDQNSGVVAANGQYILVRREAYYAVGGHESVATEILEDVALARKVREKDCRVYFRYAEDAVQTRMYRSWAELRDGWTKNLALLFPRPLRRAGGLVAWWMVAWVTLPVLIPAAALYIRLRRAGFARSSTLLAGACGVPVFAYLLLRSRAAHAEGDVTWKGRTYSSSGRAQAIAHGGRVAGPPAAA